MEIYFISFIISVTISSSRRTTTELSTLPASALAKSSLLLLTTALSLLAPAVQSLPQPPSSSDAVAAGSLQFQQLPTDCPIERSLQVRIAGSGTEAGKTVTLHLLESSTDFLHSSERSGAGGGVVGSGGRQLEPSTLPPCFYQGSVEGEEGLAIAKLRNGWISGNFHYAGRVYEISEQPVAMTPLIAQRMPPGEKRTCSLSGQKPADISPEIDADRVRRHQELHSRSRRSLMLDTRSSYNDTSRKYIQLMLVGDQYYYSNQSSNMTRAQDRLWEIGNFINALYKQIGVNVITVYTETWLTDLYTLHSANNPAGANSSEMLDLFMNYRMRKLGFKTNTAAHLVSALKFAGSGDVGLAHLGKLCSFSQGGGVNSDREPNAYGVAATVAHELGHNLGLNHDEDERGCRCPDSQGCIMAAVGNEVNPVQFSNCSVFRFLDFSVSNGLGYCMSDPPADSATAGAKVACGNRIVEPGEDCDCGPLKWCNNSCCNPETCRFSPGAACASGECCNVNTCTLMSQGTVCRGQRSSCDLPEYCNGSSEWCPQVDDYKVDGTECLSGKAYCYKGRCNDRDSRCVAIFNGTGFSAAPAAWSVGTTQGNEKGFCSYNETSLNPLTYSYTACTTANQRCGLLYCVGGNLATNDPMPRWKGMDPFDTKVFDGTVSGVAITSAGYAVQNLKYSGYRDPGMVPNGAECGTNMMCVDSQCVSTNSSVTCPSCNSHGTCAQSGLCFCDTGYRPPDCLQTGGGGSLTNRLPDSVTAGTSAVTSAVTSASTIAGGGSGGTTQTPIGKTGSASSTGVLLQIALIGFITLLLLGANC